MCINDPIIGSGMFDSCISVDFVCVEVFSACICVVSLAYLF